MARGLAGGYGAHARAAEGPGAGPRQCPHRAGGRARKHASAAARWGGQGRGTLDEVEEAASRLVRQPRWQVSDGVTATAHR